MSNPCWTGVNGEDTCVNTDPGYQCASCPIGYTGYFSDGVSISTARIYVSCGQTYTSSVSQVCDDVDECSIGHGGCDINSFCHNTIVSTCVILILAVDAL